MDKTKKRRPGEGLLKFSYGTIIGKPVKWIITDPVISAVAGKFMDTPLSKFLIDGFISNNGIETENYIAEDCRCFNDYFTRRIKPELRPVNYDEDVLISPCDGMMSAYRLSPECEFSIKDSYYNVQELLQNEALAKKYQDGICLVLRLGVDNYHRYCYIDDGEKSDNCYIHGRYNPVMPLVSLQHPVYRQNSREYCIMHTKNFGDVVQMEVGACLVGRIVNHDGAGYMKRGEEKGMFQYGGSTIVLLLREGVIDLPEEVFEKTKVHIETPVLYGAKIAVKTKCEVK